MKFSGLHWPIIEAATSEIALSHILTPLWCRKGTCISKVILSFAFKKSASRCIITAEQEQQSTPRPHESHRCLATSWMTLVIPCKSAASASLTYRLSPSCVEDKGHKEGSQWIRPYRSIRLKVACRCKPVQHSKTCMMRNSRQDQSHLCGLDSNCPATAHNQDRISKMYCACKAYGRQDSSCLTVASYPGRRSQTVRDAKCKSCTYLPCNCRLPKRRLSRFSCDAINVLQKLCILNLEFHCAIQFTWLDPVLPQQVGLCHMSLIPVVLTIMVCIKTSLSQMSHISDALCFELFRRGWLPFVGHYILLAWLLLLHRKRLRSMNV